MRSEWSLGKWNYIYVYCENFVMIGQTADAVENLKNWAPIPLAPVFM
jgi:hypothetical protein